ncbi:class II fructose-bisphosphate aldolase [Patescibacteria group bacterium]|nr:class II fructose-bisphosphate aldolase [Patescibacteria group bacterium]MBU4367779.1 class II fructose-bisphosphate aldolase [Patescibacteria group bacterium]MBU4461469.1 class II fructose-bisphosphate aldolase [Patescibacteria group bacterium]MCG2700399.1 class II fructose-bisphosphate aldolase [Candidatus Parcubacteria bacterium]
MKNLQYYLKKAQKEKWAIGQFNFSDLSQLEGIIEAAKKLKSPIILGTSEGESRFLGLKQAVALKEAYQSEIGLPVFLNLDHGKSFEYLRKAIGIGYDMVHFDGSRLPLKDNIAETKEVVRCAKKAGVLTEGEVGVIGTDASKLYEGKFILKPEDLTNPKESEQYIKETGVDGLAVSIGNFHGVSIKGNPKLDTERLKQIRKLIKESFLVLHGGSGIKKQDIKKAIKLGIVKININTELRLAYTKTLKKALQINPKETTPYKYLPSAIRAVQKVVEEKILLFGSKNKI